MLFDINSFKEYTRHELHLSNFEKLKASLILSELVKLCSKLSKLKPISQSFSSLTLA